MASQMEFLYRLRPRSKSRQRSKSSEGEGGIRVAVKIGINPNTWTLDGVCTVPGDGCIDFAAILRALAGSGYHGWLVVEAEQDLRRSPPLHYAQLGYMNLRRMAEAAGFVLA